MISGYLKPLNSSVPKKIDSENEYRLYFDLLKQNKSNIGYNNKVSHFMLFTAVSDVLIEPLVIE